MPPSRAKVLPEYVPRAIIEDYEEACQICALRPKGAATLARRCLQGMIRDFWRIRRKNLAREIDALRGKVTDATWKAIDGVRKLGNIGAHMEKDINMIVDVEPGEAERLTWLIEHRVKDWYVRRKDNEERLSEIARIADTKQEQRTPAISAKASGA